MTLRRFLVFVGIVAGLALATAVGPAASQPNPNRGAQPARSILVELFSSQGCTACPRANRVLSQIAEQPDILALTFSVGYWDYLGWPDTFARPEFTARQRTYMRALGFRSPYTPQIVVNGQMHDNGSRPQTVWPMIEQARAAPYTGRAPALRLRRDGEGARVEIGASTPPDAPADVWAAAYQPGSVFVVIRAGENAGHRMLHHNVVRRFARIGRWDGAALRTAVPWCRPACAVLVQAPNGGQVMAIGSLEP